MLFNRHPHASPTAFQWDRTTGLVSLAAALLCLVPTLGFLLAWHMQVELAVFMRFAIVPSLVLLGVCEAYMVHQSPLLFNRFTSGLLGGLLATGVMDAVRVPLAYLVKGMPDYVPLIGQHLSGELVGIAPSFKAIALGYGYEYLLVGAMLGAAYALLIGKGHWQWCLAAGVIAGVAFAALPQFQLLSVAEGFQLPIACLGAIAAFSAGGLLLGTVVETLGRTRANALRVVFLRQAPTEVATR